MFFVNTLRKLGLILAGIFFGFCAVEYVSHLYVPREFSLRRFVIGNRVVPWGGWAFEDEFKNGIAEFKYCYDHTSRGFLDEDYCVKHTVIEGGYRKSADIKPKPPDAFRIMLFGDSFTFGDGVRDEEVFSSQLQKQLSDVLIDGKHVEVFNFGLPDSDTTKELRTYEKEVGRVDPDLVILQWNTNDFPVARRSHVSIIKGHYEELKDPPKYLAWSRALTALWRGWRKRKVSEQLIETTLSELSSTPKNFDEIDAFRHAVMKNHQEFVLLLFPELYHFSNYPYRLIVDALMKKCHDENISCINLLPKLSEYRDSDLWVHPSDLHPNKIAHTIAATEIIKFLERTHSH